MTLVHAAASLSEATAMPAASTARAVSASLARPGTPHERTRAPTVSRMTSRFFVALSRCSLNESVGRALPRIPAGAHLDPPLPLIALIGGGVGAVVQVHVVAEFHGQGPGRLERELEFRFQRHFRSSGTR